MCAKVAILLFIVSSSVKYKRFSKNSSISVSINLLPSRSDISIKVFGYILIQAFHRFPEFKLWVRPKKYQQLLSAFTKYPLQHV
jgi:hypothetical protein